MGYGFCYAQDPAYDRNNDTLYIAGYFNNGFPSALLTCDTLSGACTIVGNFQGNMEVDGFAIPYNCSNPPTTPNIYGPGNGTTNVEYTFCTDAITDLEGDSLYCLWDWGDGSNSGWLGPYASGETMCASHMWTQPGVYCIMLKLKDSYGMESEWSDPFCITIVENHPPSDLIIDGPNHCRVGVEYKWSFVSTDPDGDNITYYVDWGDECGGAEWHGPYPSGKIVFLAHMYTTKNMLIINAMAVDEHGAESNMTYFEVAIPRSISINSMLLKLLERFSHAFPMLRYILELQ
jgi:hypothetical protein